MALAGSNLPSVLRVTGLRDAGRRQGSSLRWRGSSQTRVVAVFSDFPDFLPVGCQGQLKMSISVYSGHTGTHHRG